MLGLHGALRCCGLLPSAKRPDGRIVRCGLVLVKPQPQPGAEAESFNLSTLLVSPMSSIWCSRSCACKAGPVEPDTPLTQWEQRVLTQVSTIMVQRHNGVQAVAALDTVKCRQPAWAYLLSLPLYIRGYSCSLLHYSVLCADVALAKWVLAQGVCPHSGHSRGNGWGLGARTKRPFLVAAYYSPLSCLHHWPPSARSQWRRLLVGAGAHPSEAGTKNTWGMSGSGDELRRWRMWHLRAARSRVVCLFSVGCSSHWLFVPQFTGTGDELAMPGQVCVP
jgi:hypothetical protein